MPSPSELDNRLSADIHLLGDTLGKVIRKQSGIEIFGLVELMRGYTKARRVDHTPEIDAEIARLVSELPLERTENLARAYTTYFELINAAEANHRTRITRERERNTALSGFNKSIAVAIEELWKTGVSTNEMQDLLNRLHIELVFTAHPTEAKRRTVLSKLLRIGRILYDLETQDLLPRELDDLSYKLQAEVTSLWLTGRTREKKPTVDDEVRVGLFYFQEVIWDVIPRVYKAMNQALAKFYPTVTPPNRFLTFGSWMGGDRDGNPNVVASVTAETLRLHRGLALEQHHKAAHLLGRSLSISERLKPISADLKEELDSRLHELDEHVAYLAERYPQEPYRLYSAILSSDLSAASKDGKMADRLLGRPVETPAPRIRTVSNLLQPIEIMEKSLRDSGAEDIADVSLEGFQTQATVFGLNTTCLDIRQESSHHDEILAELFQKLGVIDNYVSLNMEERLVLLQELLNRPIPDLSQLTGLSDKTAEQLALMQLLKRGIDTYGRNIFGPYIISMTRSSSDIFTVHLFAYWHSINKRADGQPDGLAISPLFETRDDLESAPRIMTQLFREPEYMRHLEDFSKQLTIMIGYSDSNKDAGYLAANWELYLAQTNLAICCDENKVLLTLFHGRGGSVARGGGPMKRAILSQPYRSMNGRFRITEQGEVLYEKYSTTEIARNHLEQVVHSILLASNPRRKITIKEEWRTTMAELASLAHRAYRSFVYDSPELVHYWQEATPIREISKMRIGSRPAKRAKSGDPFAYLRAIPWVFSWMQCRHVLPGWYGVGSALEAFTSNGEDHHIELLQEMYREWQFFKAVIDNAQMSLGQTDMGIAKLYSELVEDETIRNHVYGQISAEYQLTCRWILHITGQNKILDNDKTLQNGIRARNPYVDPLNFIQINLLRKYRALDPESAEAEVLLEAIFLTINGIAAGLKNTG